MTYWEIYCDDGDFYIVTEEGKNQTEKYLKDHNVTPREIGIQITKLIVMKHMPSCIVSYVDEVKDKLK